MSPNFHRKSFHFAALCTIVATFSVAPAFAHEEQPSTAQKDEAPLDASPSVPNHRSSSDDGRDSSGAPHRGASFYDSSVDSHALTIDDSLRQADPPWLTDRLGASDGAESIPLPPSADDSDARCTGDVTQDGIVNYDDLWAILRYWGACGVSARGEAEFCPTDLDDDQQTEFSDLLLVISGWGHCIEKQ